jgi:hypothetical protein
MISKSSSWLGGKRVLARGEKISLYTTAEPSSGRGPVSPKLTVGKLSRGLTTPTAQQGWTSPKLKLCSAQSSPLHLPDHCPQKLNNKN